MEQNTTKIPFFEGTRREIVLQNWAPKRNTENEKRMRLDFRLPLEGGKIVGFPAFIYEAFEAMSKQPRMDVSSFKQEIEGIVVDFYATEEGQVEFTLRSCTLRDFSIARLKDKSDTTLTLLFNTTVPRDKRLLKWADEYDGQTLYAKFSEGQMSIPAPDPQMSLGENHNDIQGEERRGAVNAMTLKEKAALSKVDKGARASAKRASEARA